MHGKEMPALLLLRRKTTCNGEKPLQGAKIIGCSHVTAQAAVSCVLLKRMTGHCH